MKLPTLRAVIRPGCFRSSTFPAVLVACAAMMLVFALVAKAAPLSSATVTRLENSVKYGEVRGRESVTRRAAVADIVRASNFLLTETDARAELQYEDGSIVRVGQNTVFSFEADSRTLTLQKGSFIFFVPKGSGGGTIKTPSLTAAITGTVGKVSRDTIAVLEGEITLIPSGRKVAAGYFARRNPDGSITIAKFDPSKAMDGRLMAFNGPMPGFAEDSLTRRGARFDASVLSRIETLNRTQNLPSAIEQFFPDEPERTPVREEETKVFVPPPRETPQTPPPTRPGGGGGGGGGEPPY